MSGRVKSQAELDQEKRDEELARALQMEDERAAMQQRAPQQQQQQMPGGGRPIQHCCPTCLAINNIPPHARNQSHACGACGRTMPPIAEETTEGAAGPSMGTTDGNVRLGGQSRQPAQHYNARAITCQNCRSLNQIPPGTGATQFLCGGCGRVLGFNQPIETPAPPLDQRAPPSVPIGGPSSGTTPIGTDAMPPQQNRHMQQGGAPQQAQVLQGQPATRQVQVRCFQCQTINAVNQTPGQQLQFMCGSCKAVNKV